MPMIQNGPPEWIWQRPLVGVDLHVVAVPMGGALYELSVVAAGGEIVRLHPFTADEMHNLHAQIVQNVH